MTDTEYNIIDELYFVTPYAALKEETGYADEILQASLAALVMDGFVKVYLSVDEELNEEAMDMDEGYKTYSYLASKKGLFEHNQR